MIGNDNMKATFTLAKWLAVAGAVFIAGHAHAADCQHQVYPTAVCLEWAPISGDVSDDKCTIAKLDAKRLENDYDTHRKRTIAELPLPSREVILDRLSAAADRVTRDCIDHAASIP